MRISITTKTVIPNTTQGYRMADEIEERLKTQGCFVERKETTHAITIVETAIISVKDEEIKNDNTIKP